MTISALYTTIATIVKMTIQNPMTSRFGDHPGKQYVIGLEKIPLHQHLENEYRQLNELLHQRNPYIAWVVRCIMSWKRRMNTSQSRWHSRSYPI
jgi:hypothetical protein